MTQREAHPRDPLRVYQFRVGLLRPPRAEESRPGDFYVAGVQKVSGLNMTVEANEVWEGGNTLHRYANPDRATWDPITLEQGLALDDSLELWAHAVIDFLKRGNVDPDVPVKRNVLIDVWEPLLHMPGPRPRTQGLRQQRLDQHIMGGGQDRLRRYYVFNAWISRYHAVPALDAMSNEVALLSVELVHEGWRVAQSNELPSDLLRPNAS